jgi:hypothetical protein
MARRNMRSGICHICKKSKQLSFEHIPPKVAFNKYTKYRSVPFIEYVQNSHLKDYKPKAKLEQGGIGRYCLCRDCNSFLGNNYVPDYFKIAQIGKSIFKEKNFTKASFVTIEISPLRLLKQVVAMFVCANDSGFTDTEPELLEFLKNPKEKFLPEKFRVFMYLNNVGQIRNLTEMYTNKYGLVNEITFPPFGFVLSINSKYSFPLTEITHFKNIDYDYRDEVSFELINHPTHLPFPIDYRTQEEIDETVRENEKYN